MADLTQFDVRSARRIASVVQAVEQEPRRAKPLVFGPVFEQRRGGGVRFATFSGSWPINTSNTITFANSQTAMASNILWPLHGASGGNCAVAKDGTAWSLIVPQLSATAALSGATLGTASLQFTRINAIALGTASAVAISVTTCSTAAS
jgi:hypothetical protein